MSERGIILVGHGSRDPLWRGPIEAVAARLAAAQPGVPARCAYLELQQPDIASAVGDLLGAGARRISLVPMFLGTGKHAREDLPRIVERLREAHPQASFVLQPPVGEDARVLDLLAAIALE